MFNNEVALQHFFEFKFQRVAKKYFKDSTDIALSLGKKINSIFNMIESSENITSINIFSEKFIEQLQRNDFSFDDMSLLDSNVPLSNKAAKEPRVISETTKLADYSQNTQLTEVLMQRNLSHLDNKQIEVKFDVNSLKLINEFDALCFDSISVEDLNRKFSVLIQSVSIHSPKVYRAILGKLFLAQKNADVILNIKNNNELNIFNSLKNSLSPECNADEMGVIFLSFIEKVSINSPKLWRELETLYFSSLAKSKLSDDTKEPESIELAQKFCDLIVCNNFDKKTLQKLVQSFKKCLDSDDILAQKIIIQANESGLNDSQKEAYKIVKEKKVAENLNKQLHKKTRQVDNIDKTIQHLGNQLENSFDKNEQDYLKVRMQTHIYNKKICDMNFSDLTTKVKMNKFSKFSDDYAYQINTTFKVPDKKDIHLKKTKDTSKWFLLRKFRRKDLKSMIYKQDKDKMIDVLWSVPKWYLINGLTTIPKEKQIKALKKVHYSKTLMKKMPRIKLMRMLPSAKEFLAIMLMMKKTSLNVSGKQLMKKTLFRSINIVQPKNTTKLNRDICPSIIEDLKGKPKRLFSPVGIKQGHLNSSTQLKQSLLKNKFLELNSKKKFQLSESDKFNEYKNLLKKSSDLKKNMQSLDNKMSLRHKLENFDTLISLKKQQAEYLDYEAQIMNYKKYSRVDVNQVKDQTFTKLAHEQIKSMSKSESLEYFAASKGVPENLMKFLNDIDNVKSYADAKQAVSRLSNDQAESLKMQLMCCLRKEDFYKVHKYSGKTDEDMANHLPNYVIFGFLHDLKKVQVIEAYKTLDKSDIIERLNMLNDQVLTSATADVVDRNYVETIMAYEENLAGLNS